MPNSIIRTNSDHTDLIQLVRLLDADLKIRDGDEHAFYDQFNKIQHIRHVVVFYKNEKPVGCGAFKAFDEQQVEIKRMYVLPEYRGQAIGLQVLEELEKWAAELSYTGCILETGRKQPEAIRLYEKAGYQLIKNYGQYEHVENSVCMAKKIA